MTVEDRRALEALRNGVPNAAAIRALGCGQPAIEARFREGLESCVAQAARDRQAPGLLVEGDFGSGKSHLLGYLEQVAAEQNFICSRIAISKETVLTDPGRMFRAAVEAAILPDARGVTMDEIDARLSRRKREPEYADLYQWAASDGSGLWQGFAASMRIWESPPDGVDRKIVDFWGGQPLKVTTLRNWVAIRQLKDAFPSIPTVKVTELQPQHVRFAARLFKAAGYAGWVVLLDELELVGRYSGLQRARAYGELARWLGLSQATGSPGLFTVAAITEDFTREILDERQDRVMAASMLRSRGDDTGAARAELGIQAIANQALRLKSPDGETLARAHDTLRALHGRAYGWEAPALETGRRDTTTRMRSYIRRWITEWDLLRFQPGSSHEIAATELRTGYEEDADLAADVADGAPDDGA